MAARRRDAALAVLPAAAGVAPGALHFRSRRRQTPTTQYPVQDRQRQRVVVEEGPAQFAVNLSDYLDTGLYLDARGVRRLVREAFAEAFAARPGGRFLNLYAYTCTATVQAALGGAGESVSVDLSNTYLNWAGDNFERNGLDPRRHRRIRADVTTWLEGPGQDEGVFQTILLDPPTFSNSASTPGDLDIVRDHGRLLDAAVRLLEPGGTLLFVAHARRFRLAWEPPAGFEIAEITHQTLDRDCARGRPAHRCFRLQERSAGAV